MKVRRVAVGRTPQAAVSTAMKMSWTMAMTTTVRPRRPNLVREAEECLNLMKMTKYSILRKMIISLWFKGSRWRNRLLKM